MSYSAGWLPGPPRHRASLRAGLTLLALCALLGSITLLGGPPAAAQQKGPDFPALSGRVVDGANLLDAAQEAALTAKLKALEDETTDQLVVVTVPSLQGYPIEVYGHLLGRQWGIGTAELDNGVLLIVAPEERKVRIEVGYGLEGELTDLLSHLIIENAILPRFRQGDFPGGIEAGVDDIALALTGREDELKQRALPPQHADGEPDWIVVLIWVFIVLYVIYLFRYGGMPLGGGGRSNWGGGSRWRGLGGGFSGRGGGFGGGGASGSW